MALIKTEILTSPKVLYAKSGACNQFLFCKKMLFKIQIFLAKNVSLLAKKNCQSLFVKIFQVSAEEGMGK